MTPDSRRRTASVVDREAVGARATAACTPDVERTGPTRDETGSDDGTQPRRREMHIIVDNLSAHKTQQVRTFLVAHPSIHLHYTPTYSSWLNQVELWFSKIERDVTARGIFTSVTDLRRKLMRYIKHYNKTATPIRWSYADPSRRIA